MKYKPARETTPQHGELRKIGKAELVWCATHKRWETQSGFQKEKDRE